MSSEPLQRVRGEEGAFTKFFGRASYRGELLLYAPEMDVLEREREVQIITDMPGLEAEDIELDLENNVLTIRGERRQPAGQAEDVKYHLAERRYGTFSRSLVLPGDLDADSIEARLHAGVLTISIPKLERARKRRIEVGDPPGESSVPHVRAAGLEGDPTTRDPGDEDERTQGRG